VQLRNERCAIRFARGRIESLLPRLLVGWSALTTQSLAVQWRFKWRRALHDVANSLHAWSLRTRLMAAARTRHEHCSWRLLHASIRWWRCAMLERRAELELQVGALRAWGFGAAQCRRARDDTLRGRWVDELTEGFAMRRLLRLVLHGFTAWSAHAGAVRIFRTRLGSQHDRDLKGVALCALKRNVALGRLGKVDALLNGLSALAALRKWRLTAKGLMVTSSHNGMLRRAAWKVLQVAGRRRRAARHLANALESHLGMWAVHHWQRYGDSVDAAEESACRCITSLRCKSALRALRAHGQASLKKTMLPAVLRAWRQACRESSFTRRLHLSRGVRSWRAYSRSRWTSRRRLAVAELLGARRRLRGAFLPWQLLCFTETPSHEMLLERWSDAVAAPGVLRPLMVLQASNINNSSVALEEKKR